MNILFACDNNYAKYLSVTILSILTSRDKCNENYTIHFYILSLDIDHTSVNYITSLLENRNAEIYFIEIHDADFKQFPIHIDYLSKATYARLKSAQYLPPHLEKVLYLDIDILVNHSLLDLWNTDISLHSLAACEDPFIEYSTYKNSLSLNPKHTYFNAGVLLINLNKWRTLDLFNLALSAVKNKTLIYQDQDILNILFENDVFYLDARYNFTRNHREIIKRRGNQHSVIASMPIAIYHYVGAKKSWHATCTSSRAALFDYYFQTLKNPPSHWQIEPVPMWQK